MTDKSAKNTPHVIEPSSAIEDPQRRRDGRAGGRESGKGGANAKPSELTVLERRVLAHERILQALIGHLAYDDPEILERLKLRFGAGYNLGEYEQDYVSTEHYGEHFIGIIEKEVKRYEQP